MKFDSKKKCVIVIFSGGIALRDTRPSNTNLGNRKRANVAVGFQPTSCYKQSSGFKICKQIGKSTRFSN